VAKLFSLIKPDSIQEKMVLTICLFLTVLLGSVAFATYFYFKQSICKIVCGQQTAMISSMARGLDDKIFSMQNILEESAQSFPIAFCDNTKNAQEWLEQRHLTSKLFRHGLFLFDEQGVIITSSGENSPHCLSDSLFKK
jgi:hypothetical protein